MSFLTDLIQYFFPKKNKRHTHKKTQPNRKKKLVGFQELDDLNHSGEILIQSKNKVQTKKDFDTIYHYTIKNKNLTHQELHNAIDINIKFLTLLLYKLENSIYITEYQKVSDMLQQSNTCKNILTSISNNQIFYKNTVDIIKRHTLSVGKLVKIINKLDIAGDL